MLKFRCPSCERRFEAAPSAAGTDFVCPCGARMKIPVVVEIEPEPLKIPKVRCAVCGMSVPEWETEIDNVPAGSWMGSSSGHGGHTIFGTIWRKGPVCRECRKEREDRRERVWRILLFMISCLCLWMVWLYLWR